MYAPTYDLSRLRWSGEVKVVMVKVAKECRGGSYITIEDLAPHGEEFVEFLVNDCRNRDPQRLLHESPRRRKIEESMSVSFLSTLPEEEWERYQSELESKTGATWNRVNFMERSWDVIRRYGTQSKMKVGLNQPIMREVLEKKLNSIESDVLTESLTEDSADD